VVIAAGLMFSPDTLVLFGNGVGALGALLLVVLPLAILVHLGTVSSLGELHATPDGFVGGLRTAIGNRTASILLICGKLPFAICASAGLVVTAGFVFNEVFVYWFPNFTFAYLLLILVLVLNIFSPNTALRAQAVAIAGAGTGLLVLACFGILGAAETEAAAAGSGGFDIRYLSAAVIVLVGYDMGLTAGWQSRLKSSPSIRVLVIALLIGGVLLALWGLAAMILVPAAKLESSTIPHMIVARKALGQPGRIIMGLVAIFGVFAAVNAMLHSISMTTKSLASAMGDADMAMSPARIRVITLLFTAIASATLMFLGFAGEPILESWIRGGMVLWLIYYASLNVAAIRRGSSGVEGRGKGGGANTATLLRSLAIIGTALTIVGLVLLEPALTDMLVFLVAVTAAIIALVIGAGFYTNRGAHKISEDHSGSVHP